MKKDPKISAPPDWRVGEATLVQSTPYFDLQSRRVQMPSSHEADFYFINCRDWVKIIPITANNEIVFIRQFRPHVNEISLEIPGGTMDPAETSPIEAARRELGEETGYSSERVEELGVVFPNPALFSNRCFLFAAYEARPTTKQRLDPTEDIQVELIPMAEVKSLLLEGKIGHALVAAALSIFLLKTLK